jgi:hypothetical protein
MCDFIGRDYLTRFYLFVKGKVAGMALWLQGTVPA